jgi:diguanylate cyclase
MLAAAIEMSLTVLVTFTGVGFGWWLRGTRRKQMAAYDGAMENVDRAGEILARLQELATSVASDVGQHSSRVREINRQLATSGHNGTEAVVQAVAKLLANNEQMQQQLAAAEGRLKEQAQRIETYAVEARTDPLTRLPNRRAFDNEMNALLAESHRTAKRFSIVMLDVDHFKRFNDTYGHQAGDEVLRNVADVLRRSLRERAMVARFGGEEFVVTMPGGTIATAQGRVEKIRKAIEDSHVRFNGTELKVTVSLGLAEWIGGEAAGQLVERADAALYAAKEAGRNRAYWNDGQANYPIATKQESPDAAPGGKPQPASDPTAPVMSCKPAATGSETPENRSAESGGMPNRMAFCTLLRHRLAEWRRGGRTPSVVLVRVDEFDRVLAQHGPRGGKLVLEATAKFLTAAVREMDIVAAIDDRLFAILLPGAGLINAINISERLRQAIATCTLPGDHGQIQFTVSIGGAEAERRDDTAQLLRRAEEALLASTKSGGNCSYFHNGQWSETAAVARERLQTA